MSRVLAGELRSMNVKLEKFEEKYLAGITDPDEKKFVVESIEYYRKQIEKAREEMAKPIIEVQK